MRTKSIFLTYTVFLAVISFFIISCKKDVTPVGQPVEVVAGTGVKGFVDGPLSIAQFYTPSGITIDLEGNLYIADKDNHSIRKISINGMVSTLAGLGVSGFVDGPNNVAKFNQPGGVALDPNGNVYIADWDNHKIRKISSDGVVSTFAGSTGGFLDANKDVAQFRTPKAIVRDAVGNFYISDYDNHRVRKISLDGVVSTIAGNGIAGYKDGNGSNAQFFKLRGLAIDNLGNLFVADAGNNRIRKINPEGLVTTLAGDGTAGFADGKGSDAKFNDPKGIAIDKDNNLYIADQGNHRIRKITPLGVVSTIAGDGIIGSNDRDGSTPARFNAPRDIVIDASGKFAYVADQNNHMIRKITL